MSSRDPFVDVLRAFAVVIIVAQHWLMPVLAYDDGVLVTGNALAAPGAWALTWISQVMPLVFFAGGAAAMFSLRSRGVTRSRYEGRPVDGHNRWLHTRLLRLGLPVLPLVAVWVPMPHLLIAMGVPAGPVETSAKLAGRLLWFLALYVLITALTPMLVRLYRRWGGVEVVALAAAAVGVDVVRFGLLDGADAAGVPNILFVWISVYQLGIVYAGGGLRGVSGRRALAFAGAGLAITSLAVAFGPYPGSMIGMPGAPVSNMNPPTAVLLAVAAWQLGLALAVRPHLTAWAGRQPVARGLAWISARLMTIYVWHMPALIVVAGVAVVWHGWSTPEVMSEQWRQVMPLWLAALGLVLAGFVRVVSRAERAAVALLRNPLPAFGLTPPPTIELSGSPRQPEREMLNS